MYRINSISKQLVPLQVVNDGTLRAVNLLPGNFVFSEKITSQLKNLQANGCIRIREVQSKSVAPAKRTTATVASNGIANNETDKSSKNTGSKVSPTAAETTKTANSQSK